MISTNFIVAGIFITILIYFISLLYHTIQLNREKNKPWKRLLTALQTTDFVYPGEGYLYNESKSGVTYWYLSSQVVTVIDKWNNQRAKVGPHDLPKYVAIKFNKILRQKLKEADYTTP